MIPELYYPVLDCFVRGLPYSYRNSVAPAGTNILLDITGECGGRWILSKETDAWIFLGDIPKSIACKVTLPQAIAWRVFTKGIAPDAALAQVQIEGDQDLAYGILGHTAIVG
jgi:hypothetical protein